MRARLGATAAGVVLIAAAVLGFSLAKHPAVAGTNDVDPLYDTVFLHGGVRYCQQVPSLPAEVSAVQIHVSRASGSNPVLEVLVVGPGGRLGDGRAAHVSGGDLEIRLRPVTPEHGVRHAGICFTDASDGKIVLSGETKRCTARDTGAGVAAPCVHPANKPPGEKYRWLVGIRFLKRGSTDWLSQRNQIIDRFGLGQAGWFGKWAAWLAVVLAILSAALALWWLVRDPRSET
jgi:hypothetical protein